MTKKLTPWQEKLRASAEKGPTAYEGYREERDAHANEARRAKKAKKHNPFAELERAVAADDQPAVKAAMAKLSTYHKDLLVSCASCKAAERKPCVKDNLVDAFYKVHFVRHVSRVLEGIK